MWHAVPHDFPSNSPSAVIEHHESVAAAIDANPTIFVIVDKASWREAGILIVNLSFEKYVDAFRFLPSRAGDIVPALTTTTTWDELLRNADRPFFPRAAFAVYFLATDGVDLTSYKQNEVLEALNGGFEGRKNLPPRKWGSKPGVCVSASPEAQGCKSVEEAKSKHAELVEKLDFSSEYFIISSKQSWAEPNAVLVGVDVVEGKDVMEVELPAEFVGELVQWIWVGLTSLEEIVRESRGGEVGPRRLWVKSG